MTPKKIEFVDMEEIIIKQDEAIGILKTQLIEQTNHALKLMGYCNNLKRCMHELLEKTKEEFREFPLQEPRTVYMNALGTRVYSKSRAYQSWIRESENETNNDTKKG